MVCWGATTVQIHLPSLSWAELYTCQLSSGLVGNTWRGAGGEGDEERMRKREDEDERDLCLGAKVDQRDTMPYNAGSTLEAQSFDI